LALKNGIRNLKLEKINWAIIPEKWLPDEK
jgi:hypothetical protein